VNLAALDLNLLVVFEALMRERNVTRAATTLGLSQPAVSNALARLRDQVGDRLFLRGPRAMLPTPRALELAPDVDAALDRLRTALGRPDFAAESSRATFRLAASDESELALLPGLFERLDALAPGIAMRWTRLAGIWVVPAAELQSGALDFAVGAFPRPTPADSGLFFHELGEARFVCIARGGHPVLGRARTLGLRRFCALEHVATFYPGGGPGFIDRLLADHGRKREVRVSLPHWLSVPFVVAASDLIATVPESVADQLAPLLALRRFKCPVAIPRIRMSLVWHARTHESRAHAWFRRVLIAAATTSSSP
jgi:DNA-binding transcriptional LysR family regulator